LLKRLFQIRDNLFIFGENLFVMRKENVFIFLTAVLLALMPGCKTGKQEVMRETEWLPATVPGTVHTDLMANGKIEDPYFRLNEHQVQWVDKVDWEYRTHFDVAPELLAIRMPK